MLKICGIYAQDLHGHIGLNGGLPWGRELPEDLAEFKRKTLGQLVVMGRKTAESLPPSMCPLPGRYNAVVSSKAEHDIELEIWLGELARHGYGEVQHWRDPRQLLTMFRQSRGKLTFIMDSIWVIGGQQLLESVQDLLDEVHVTQIYKRCEGDTHAPALDFSRYAMRNDSPIYTSRSGLLYQFQVYRTRAAAQREQERQTNVILTPDEVFTPLDRALGRDRNDEGFPLTTPEVTRHFNG